MEELPVDIKMEIFSRLPPDPLLNCKLVCKTWEKLLSHRKVGLLFLIRTPSKRNLELYYGSYDEIYDKANSGEEFPHKSLTKIIHPGINWQGSLQCFFIDHIVGSCNGLVCIRVPHHKVLDPVYICNPITTEYINLPRIKHKKGFVVSGFGYHPSNNKFKVIRIHYPDREYSDMPITSKGSVEIYTLGSDSGWRSIGEITYAISRRGVLANGTIYWLDYEQAKIVAFDLLNEEFRVLPTIPQCLDVSDKALYRKKKILYQMRVLGGRLCLVYYVFGKDMDIWSYKKIDDVEEGSQSWSWILEFRIPSSVIDVNELHEPFALTKNNEVLIWVAKRGISCYDKKTESLKVLVEEDYRLGECQGIPHMSCFLSVKSFGMKVKSRKNQHTEKKMSPNNKTKYIITRDFV